LKENPRLGKSIGQDSYKIGLAVKSKGKGKSGGLRIISHLDTEIIGLIESEEDAIVVNLTKVSELL